MAAEPKPYVARCATGYSSVVAVDPATGAVERVRLIGHSLSGAGRPESEPEPEEPDAASDLEPEESEEPTAEPAE